MCSPAPHELLQPTEQVASTWECSRLSERTASTTTSNALARPWPVDMCATWGFCRQQHHRSDHAEQAKKPSTSRSGQTPKVEMVANHASQCNEVAAECGGRLWKRVINEKRLLLSHNCNHFTQPVCKWRTRNE